LQLSHFSIILPKIHFFSFFLKKNTKNQKSKFHANSFYTNKTLLYVF